MLRKQTDNNCRVTLSWTPESKRGRGRPKTTWRSTIERESKDLGWTSWNAAVEQVAKDREGWKLLLRAGLMFHSRSEEDE